MVKFYNGVESRWPQFIDAQSKAMSHVNSMGIQSNEALPSREGKDVAYVELESGSTSGSSMIVEESTSSVYSADKESNASTN